MISRLVALIALGVLAACSAPTAPSAACIHRGDVLGYVIITQADAHVDSIPIHAQKDAPCAGGQ